MQLYKKKVFFQYSVIIFISICILFSVQPSVFAAGNSEEKPIVMYFYTSVCDNCRIAEKALDEFYNTVNASGRDIHFDVRMQNIEQKRNYELFQKYLEFYKVPDKDRHTPIIFFGDAWYSGEDGIRQGLKAELEKENIKGAELLKLSDADQERVL